MSFSSSSSTLPRGLTLRHTFVLSFEKLEGHLSPSSSQLIFKPESETPLLVALHDPACRRDGPW